MTLNDLEWLFRVKFCFRAGFSDNPTVRFSKKNCMETNKDRATLSTAQIFDRESSFWQCKVCAFSRKRTVGSRVSKRLELLSLDFENSGVKVNTGRHIL